MGCSLDHRVDSCITMYSVLDMQRKGKATVLCQLAHPQRRALKHSLNTEMLLLERRC
mgnify:CR=1 FL=1|jgi:hypothetical protein